MQRLPSEQSTIASKRVTLLILLNHVSSDSHCGFAFTPLKYDGINTTLKRGVDNAIVSNIRSAKISASYSFNIVLYNLFFLDDYICQPHKKKDRSTCFLFTPLKGEVLPL